MSSLLIVDDEHSICWGLTRLGQTMGHEVVAASSAEQAFDIAERQSFDAVVLDVRLPGMDGITAIERFQRQLGNVPIIVITAYGDLKTAVEAVRRGAFDYIAKPFDVEKVKGALLRALLSRQAGSAKQPAADAAPQVEGMVGRSSAMQEVYKRIALAAASEAPVLVSGESGTGKDLAARAIHRYSSRAEQPFVVVSLAALNPSLAECELFGHVRGAFAGADDDRVGLLVKANGGTLFLDEVADIPLTTQVKLLRALEQHEVVPVGSNVAIPTSFRVISATRQNLLERTTEGYFRRDLLFRLGTFQVELPALRDRPEDIGELGRYLVARLTGESGQPTANIAAETLRELGRRPWHGNVRELRNAIEHALILARGRTILPEHMPPAISVASPDTRVDGCDRAMEKAIRGWAARTLGDASSHGAVYEKLLEAVEPTLFRAAMARYRGQCATAARALGLHRTTLRKKLTQHGLSGDDLPEA